MTDRTRRPHRMATALFLGLALAPAAAPRPTTALPKLKTEVAFPNLKFDRPVALAYPDDGSNLLFVVEQHQAKIQSFPDEKDTTDDKRVPQAPRPDQPGQRGRAARPGLPPQVQAERRVLRLLLGPRQVDGKHERRSVVSRFKVSKDDPRKADPASEERIWVSADDPFENHNGGCIAFGPDGFLYISLGDSGAGRRPADAPARTPSDWFGSILRIDVDHPADGKPYGIPAGQPRSSATRKFADWAPEVYCIGLRNVWKFTFDRETGTLWAGDVGQNKWEMVHIIKNGGNYGWSIKEGVPPVRAPAPQKADPASPITPPIVEYPHGPSPTRTARTSARASPAATSTGARPCPSWTASTSTATSQPAGSGASASQGRQGRRQRRAGRRRAKPEAEHRRLRRGPPRASCYILAFDGRIHRLAQAK